MADRTKQSEGPTCACGRGDLYMESLKLKNMDQAQAGDSTTPNRDEKENGYVDSADKEDSKPEQWKMRTKNYMQSIENIK